MTGRANAGWWFCITMAALYLVSGMPDCAATYSAASWVIWALAPRTKAPHAAR